MARGDVHYPHRIGYRLDDEAWVKLERVVEGTGLSPHDWCRIAALERLKEEHGLTRSERLFFEQVARTQYLVAQGFQLLADEKLSTEEWKKLRNFAREKIKDITQSIVADISLKEPW